MRVLIADDQASVHEFLQVMVDWKSLGFSQIDHVYSGKEALQMIKERLPDILILDIRMPQMDGLEMLKKLNVAGLHVNTIILSAYNEFENAREAMRYGVKDYQLKPIDIRSFLAVLHEMTEKIKTDRSTENKLYKLFETMDNKQFRNFFIKEVRELKFGYYEMADLTMYHPDRTFGEIDYSLVELIEKELLEMLDIGYSEALCRSKTNKLFAMFAANRPYPDEVYRICGNLLYAMEKKADGRRSFDIIPLR